MSDLPNALPESLVEMMEQYIHDNLTDRHNRMNAIREGKVVHYTFVNGELYWYLDLKDDE